MSIKFNPSLYERRLIKMPLASFAQAVRDIPDNKLEELSRWFPGCDPKAKLVWDQVKWRNMTSSQDDAISYSSDDEESKVENVPAISCYHERFLSSKSRSAMKREIVKQKRHRQKEAIIAQKCGHASACKPIKTRVVLPKLDTSDVIDPNDVWWDVYNDHIDDCEQDRLDTVARNEMEQWGNEQQQPQKPGPWDLDLEPYMTDMYEEMCGAWSDSDADSNQSFDYELAAVSASQPASQPAS